MTRSVEWVPARPGRVLIFAGVMNTDGSHTALAFEGRRRITGRARILFLGIISAPERKAFSERIRPQPTESLWTGNTGMGR